MNSNGSSTSTLYSMDTFRVSFLLQAWDDPRNPGATRARSGEEDVPRTGAGAAGRGPVIFGEFSVAAILVIVWI